MGLASDLLLTEPCRLAVVPDSQVKEFTIDYTRCEFDASDSASTIPNSKYSYNMGDSSNVSPPTWQFRTDDSANATQRNICTITFDVPVTMPKPVFMYYKLTNYYQNHRRYVQSFDSEQLKGKDVSYSSVKDGGCKPLDVNNGKPYYPCGLIANSYFNGEVFSVMFFWFKHLTGSDRHLHISGPSQSQWWRLLQRDLHYERKGHRLAWRG